MTNFDLLRQLATSARRAGFKGHWYAIEFRPDLFVPQAFTVGVVVTSEGEAPIRRIMRHVGKLNCVYGKNIKDKDFEWAFEHVDAWLGKELINAPSPEKLELPSPHFFIGEGRYVAGNDRVATLNRLFEQNVILATHQGDDDPNFFAEDNASVRAQVNQHLKRIWGTDFERIANPEGITLLDGKSRHEFAIGYHYGSKIGSVVSGVTQTKDTFERNVLRAEADLEKYSRIIEIRSRDSRKLIESFSLALFVKKPPPAAIPAVKRKPIEAFWNEYEWKLRQAGFRVTTSESSEELAVEVADWYQPTIDSNHLA